MRMTSLFSPRCYLHSCRAGRKKDIWVCLETLNTQSVTPPKTENNDGDRTLLESHAVSILPLSTFLDTPMCWSSRRQLKNVGPLFYVRPLV